MRTPKETFYFSPARALSDFRQFLVRSNLTTQKIARLTRIITPFLANLRLENLSPQETNDLSEANFLEIAGQTGQNQDALDTYHAWKDYVDAHYRTLPSSNTLLERYSQALSKLNRSESTIKNYVADVRLFFQAFAHLSVDEILTKPKVDDYLRNLTSSQLSAVTIERRTTSLRQFLAWAKEKTYIKQNPLEIQRPTPISLTPHHLPRRLDQLLRALSQTRLGGAVGRVYGAYHHYRFTHYLHIAVLAIATLALLMAGFGQFFVNTLRSQAFPTTLKRPNRTLSFQARLTDAANTSITSSTNLVFKLWDASTLGNELWTSGTCSITPDQDGIFSTLLGNTCGSEIASSVFSENQNVWLEVTVGAETLTPRQQIATVGYALNSETLQGYPASASAVENTIPVMNNSGQIVLGASSPTLISTLGTFAVKGNALSIVTNTGTGGNITLAPDGTGQIQMIGNTTTADTLTVSNANLTSGDLINGTVGNDNTGYKLISLQSGSSTTEKFSVDAVGNVIQTGYLHAPGATFSATYSGGTPIIVNGTGGQIFSIANSGNIVGAGTLTGITDLSASGTITFSGLGAGIAHLSSGGVLSSSAINLASADVTGVLPLANGGTNKNMTVAPGGVVWTDSDSMEVSAAGSSGQCLVSGGTGAPTWSSCSVAANSYWQLDATSTVLSPGNSTWDLAVGGSATASAKFIVNGTSGNASASGTLTLGGSSGVVQPADGPLTFNYKSGPNAWGTAMTIQPTTGNVGIGTTSPGGKLHIRQTTDGHLSNIIETVVSAGGQAYNNQLILRKRYSDNSNVANATLGSLNFQGNDASGVDLTRASIIGLSDAGNRGHLVFQTHDGTSLATKMKIDYAGNVGIGTTNPTSKLYVQKPGDTTYNPIVKFEDTSDPGNGSTRLTVSNPASSFILNAYGSGAPGSLSSAASIAAVSGSKFLVGAGSGMSLQMYTNDQFSTPQFTMTTSGNVGIGTTSPLSKLDVQGGYLNVSGGATFSATYAGGLALQVNGAASASSTLTMGGAIQPANGPLTFNYKNGTNTWATGITLDTVGQVSLSNLTTQAGIVYTSNATGMLAVSAQGSTGQCLVSGGTGAPTWSSCSVAANSYWQLDGTSTVLSPGNSTWDLAVGGSATASAKFIVNGTSGNASMAGTLTTSTIQPPTGPLTFNYKSGPNAWATAMTIQPTTGNVGIGTTNPLNKLQVGGTGNIALMVNSDNSGSASVLLTTASPAGLKTDPVNGRLQILAGSTEKVSVLSTGNVGIGTITPANKIEVRGGGAYGNFRSSGASNENWDFGRDNASTGNFKIAYNDSTKLTLNYSTGELTINDGLITQATNTGANTLAGTLTVSGTNNSSFAGNVGIGTTSPGSKLDVQGGYLNVSGGATFSATYSGGTPIIVNGTGGQIFSIANSGNIVGTGTLTGITDLTASGTITFSGLGAGIAHLSSGGVLSSSAINLASGDVTGVLPLANGGTNKNMTVAPGGVVWTDSDSMEVSAAGSSGQCLVSGGTGAPTWGTCGGASYWQSNAGVISPYISSYSLAVGGTSTASAKFFVDGTNGNVGIGTATPVAPLHISGTYGSNAALIINNLNGGDLLTASASGVTRFRVDTNGNALASSFQDSANPLYYIDPANSVVSLNVAGDASSAGRLYLGENLGIRPATGYLTLDYKSGPDAWSTGLMLNTVGNVGIGTTTPNTARLEVVSGSAASKGLIVRAAASPTGSIQEWQESDSTVVGKIDNLGQLVLSQTYDASTDAPSANYSPSSIQATTQLNNSGDYGNNTSAANFSMDIRVGSSRTTYGVIAGAAYRGAGSGHNYMAGGVFSSYIESTSDETVTSAVGGRFETINASNRAAHADNYYAGDFYIGVGSNTVNTASTATLAYLRSVEKYNANLSITNVYGLRVDDQTVGTNNYAILTNAGNVVFNEGGNASTDFRVEGDTDANLLFTQASTDRVGIGNASPGYKLDIVTAVANDGMSLANSAVGGPFIYLNSTNGTASNRYNGIIYLSNGTAQWTTGLRTGDGKFHFFDSVNNTDRLVIDNTGNVGLGTDTPVAPLHISGTYGTNASLIINQTGTGDILSASAAGVTQMRVSNAGVVTANDFECTNCIDTGDLKTSDSAAAGSTTNNITMNEYSFFPSIERDDCSMSGGNDQIGPRTDNATNNTTGRFFMDLACSSGTWDVRWKYVTASRDQEIFAWLDTSDNLIKQIWVSEIPLNAKDRLPMEAGNVPATWIPVQATIYDDSLTTLGKAPDLDYLQKNFTFTRYEKASLLPESDPLKLQKKLEHDICLETAKSQGRLDNPETKCFQFLTHPDIYYGKLEASSTTQAQWAQIDAQILANPPSPHAGADLAERFQGEDQITPGDIVAVSSTQSGFLQKANQASANRILGIASTAPGMVLGKNGPGNVDLALTGRVPLKIDPNSEPITMGDYLTVSQTPGLAKKATSAGFAVAKALEPWDAAMGKDSIIVFVTLGYHDPDRDNDQIVNLMDAFSIHDTSTESGTPTFTLANAFGTLVQKVVTASQAVIANLTAGAIRAQTIATNSLTVGGQKLETLIASLIDQKLASSQNLASTQSTVNSDGSENLMIKLGTQATSSATSQLTITNREDKTIASIDELGNATFSGTLMAKSGVFENLTISDASVSGVLYANHIEGLKEKVAAIVEQNLSTLPANPDSQELIALLTQNDQDLASRIFELENQTASGSGRLISSASFEAVSIDSTLLLDKTGVSSLASVLSLQSTGTGSINFLAGAMVLDSQGLMVNTDAYFAKSVVIKEDLMVDVIRSSNGDLTLRLATASSNLEPRLALLNHQSHEVASLDASGSARFNKLIIASDLDAPQDASVSGEYRSNASTGAATLPSEQSEMRIVTPKITPDSLVYVTPTSSTSNKVLYVASKHIADPTLPGDTSYFVVALDSSLPTPVSFNWWVIN